MNILAARKYATPRNGPLSDPETETRRLAYSIKSARSPAADFETAARDMAALISGPCWLVPIPDSTGDTRANTILAAHIARHVPGAQIAKAISRTRPTFSQCKRHKQSLGPIPAEDHHLARTGKALGLRQTYFVDNVTTSGNTLAAARNALGFGAGLVFADARHHAPQVQASFF